MVEERRPSGGSNLFRAELEILERIAEDALAGVVCERPEHAVPGEDEAFAREPGACFVTLLKDGALRGCMGTLEIAEPLSVTVRAMTRSAARRDPRFEPVTADELGALEIHLNILGARREVRDVREITVGEHGLVVRHGNRQGVLLPEVAVSRGWNVEEFLEHTCLKAGLASDAWRHPDAVVEIFSVRQPHPADR